MFNYYKLMKNFIADEYKRYKKTVLLAFIDAILNNSGIILIFAFFSKVLEKTLIKNDALMFLFIILFIIVIRIIVNTTKYNIENDVAHRVLQRERLDIGNKFKNFSMKYFTKDRLGEFSTIVTKDLTFLGEFGIPKLNEIVTNFMIQIISVILLLIFDYRLAIVVIITLIISMFYLSFSKKIVEFEAEKRQKQHAIFTDSAIEYAMGIPIIKAFNIFKRSDTRINKEINKTKEKSLVFENKFIPIVLIFRLIIALGVGIMIFFSLLLYKDFPNKSYMIILILYSVYVFIPALKLGDLVSSIKISESCLARYYNLKSINCMPVIDNSKVPNFYDIEFKDVYFSYSDKDTIKNISFKVSEKSVCSLVGHSGSGKTTIVNLILRFWDVDKGEIKIGSVDIRDMSLETLFSMISVVFQDVYLFNDTIMNNIKFGKEDASEEEIIKVSKMARCHDFIMSLPDKYETIVGEGGSTLSGGEKQRISIARAMLKDAPIILLDESTSSIDPDNEIYIQEAIDKLVEDKTVVVIAHKLSSIIKSNQILVLEKGEIVERGEHNELILLNGKYSKMWNKHINCKSWEIEI